MNRYFFLFTLVMSSSVVFGQRYNTLGGIRFGDDFGLTLSQRITDKNTIELIHQPGTFAGKELTSLLYKQHYSLLTKRFNFFLGGGVFTSAISGQAIDNPQSTRQFGPAFDAGAELTIGRLSIATDFIPTISLNQSGGRRINSSSGLSLRYVLVPRKSKTQKWFSKIFKKKK